MSQKAITRLDLVEGGTEIRQGHHFKLSFSPRDAGGNVVDLTGKKLDVVIVAKQGIVYETTATYNTTEKTVEFSVNENIGHGDMWIEITATDPNNASYRQKFPTAEHEGRLRFVRGTDDIAFVGFSGKTIAEFKAEQTAFQVEIDEKFERAAAALTEDSEVVLARDGEASLNVKLTKDKQAFTAQLAESVKLTDTGVLGLDVFDENARNVLQGQTPGTINAVLGLNNVKPENTDFLESLSINLIDHTKLEPGYIDGVTGAVVASESFKVSGFIEAVPGQSYPTNGGGAGGGYYGADMSFIQGIPWNAPKPLVPPTGLGIRYIRIPFSTSNIATARMNKGTVLLDYTPFISDFKTASNVKTPAENIVGKLSLAVEPTDTVFLSPTKNIFDKLRIKKGFSVSATTGSLNVQTDQNFAVIEHMKVKPSTNYQKSGNYHVAFYDASGVFISGIASGAEARSFTTPSNAATMTITIYLTQDNPETYMIYEGSAMPTVYVPPYELVYESGKRVPIRGKMVSYGDSLTQMNVWQPIVAERLGMTSVVRGIGSTTVTESGSVAWIDANGNYLDRPPATQPAGSTEILSSLSNDQRIATVPLDAAVIIFKGGTNDQFTNKPIGDKSDPNNVNTFRSAYALTLKKLQLRCPRARIFTVTPPPNNKHQTVNTAGHTGKDYADVAKEESGLLGIPCIDLYGKAGWNEYNMNVYLSDGVHYLTDTGGVRAAEVIGGEMKVLL